MSLTSAANWKKEEGGATKMFCCYFEYLYYGFRKCRMVLSPCRMVLSPPPLFFDPYAYRTHLGGTLINLNSHARLYIRVKRLWMASIGQNLKPVNSKFTSLIWVEYSQERRKIPNQTKPMKTMHIRLKHLMFSCKPHMANMRKTYDFICHWHFIPVRNELNVQ